MRKTSIVAAAFCLLIFSSSLFAQEEVESRDVLEVGLYGGLAAPTGGISTWTTGQNFNTPVERKAKNGFDLGIDLGYYLKPNLVLGFNFIYSQFDAGDPTGLPIPPSLDKQRHRLFNPNFYLKYNFEGQSNWVPYVKVHAGAENPKFSTWVLDHNDNVRKFRELSYRPAFAFGASAGLFYYTADYSGLYLEAGYHVGLTKNSSSTYQGDNYKFGEDVGLVWINLGIKVIIGSGG